MIQAVIINSVSIAFLSYVMGFIAAIPVGASQIEIAKRSLNGFLFSSIMLVAGSVLSDTMYGIVAFFGVAPFLKNETVIAYFRLINSFILIALGIYAIIGAKHTAKSKAQTRAVLNNKKVSFVMGFSLAFTNPMMMLWWLIGAQFIIGLGIITEMNIFYIIVFLISGAAGIGSYLLLLSVGIYKTKRFLSDETVHKIMIWLGVALILLAVYFFYIGFTGLINIQAKQ